MHKIIIITLGLTILAGCSTAEFRQERSQCSHIWMSKIPPVYQQETYDRLMTRQVPDGVTCSGYGNYINCIQSTRTEYYTVPTIRTVDINRSHRKSEIKYCTENSCIQKFGNKACKK